MPKGPAVVIGVVAFLLFMGSAAILIFASMRPDKPTGTGGITFGPNSTKVDPNADPLGPDPNLSDMAILPFEFKDQNGETVTNSVFAGKLTVMDFVFTNCPLACPVLSGQMEGVALQVKDPRLQFVSISVDPDRDTPDALKAYAQKFGADARWRLLRGDKAAAWKFVHDGFKFKIEDDTATPITLKDGSTMHNIRHPVHMVLVGPKGEILGMYLGTRDEDVAALVDRIKRALKKL